MPAVPFNAAVHESAHKYFGVSVAAERRQPVRGELVKGMLYDWKWAEMQ